MKLEVLMLAGSICSLKVAVSTVLMAISDASLCGEVDTTVGAVVSGGGGGGYTVTEARPMLPPGSDAVITMSFLPAISGIVAYQS
jgi:hypothetical protein